MKGEIDKNSFVRLSLSVQCPTRNAISSTFRTVNFSSTQPLISLAFVNHAATNASYPRQISFYVLSRRDDTGTGDRAKNTESERRIGGR